MNAWVDIPEEHEIEAQAHEEIHKAHANEKGRSPSPARRMWSSMINKKDREKDRGAPPEMGAAKVHDSDGGPGDKATVTSPDITSRKWSSVIGRKPQNSDGVSLISVKTRTSFSGNDKPSETKPIRRCTSDSETAKPAVDGAPTTTKTGKSRFGFSFFLLKNLFKCWSLFLTNFSTCAVKA